MLKTSLQGSYLLICNTPSHTTLNLVTYQNISHCSSTLDIETPFMFFKFMNNVGMKFTRQNTSVHS